MHVIRFIFGLMFAATKVSDTTANRKLEGSTACKDLKLVSREEWRARDPVRTRKMIIPVSHVIILHTVTPFCENSIVCTRDIQFIQDFHLDDRGWWDIAYSFVVAGDGRVYVGRGWNSTGSFSINYNNNAIGVAFVGNYNQYEPTQPMLQAVHNLIDCGILKGYLSPNVEVHGHRDVSCTESPGSRLYNEIRTWKNYKGGRLKNYNCQPLEETSTTSAPTPNSIQDATNIER